jgi:drug/metabolite transporter (DMT)-like permease
VDLIVFLAVLAAALMHAGWNAVVRPGSDRVATKQQLSMTQSGLALILLPFVSAPAPAAWPWVAGASLLHTGYKLFLIRAYQHGDLSQVYPLARGAAPPMVALGGIVLLGEQLHPLGWLAVGAIATGVALMAFRGGANVGRLPAKALAYALVTACFVAAYTLADGAGARIAKSATAFAMWMFVGDGLAMLVYAVATRGPGGIARIVRPAWKSGLPAGALSLGSYWIALWAFTRAPVALVAALRETSVLFALLIATLLLKEQAGRWRIAAGLCIGAGVVLMRL